MLRDDLKSNNWYLIYLEWRQKNTLVIFLKFKSFLGSRNFQKNKGELWKSKRYMLLILLIKSIQVKLHKYCFRWKYYFITFRVSNLSIFRIFLYLLNFFLKHNFIELLWQQSSFDICIFYTFIIASLSSSYHSIIST